MPSYTRYFALSVVTASAVLYHAFATRQHFYPTALYLSTSKLAVAVMGNLAFATALLLHKAVIKIFLGSLRDIEQELIRERLSSAIMETLLALTIFREEFSGLFLAMFAALLFLKVLHWLVQDRVDYIEATPSVSRLQHVRIAAFMTVLLVVDALFLQHAVSATIASAGQSVMLLFAFEYVIQASDVIRYGIKYGLSLLDLALEGRWAGKGICVFYLDLTTDLLHLFVYVVFFIIVFTNYGMPLHLVRDLYNTFRNFRNRIMDFLRFRQVSARLSRLPNASAEDVARSDGVCIICREELVAGGANKKLPCGHLFHTHCLRSWLERQQNCPTCRGAVFSSRRAEQGVPRRGAPPAAANAGVPGPAQQPNAAAVVAPDGEGAGDEAQRAGDEAQRVEAARPGQGRPGGPHAPLARGFLVQQQHRVRVAVHRAGNPAGSGPAGGVEAAPEVHGPAGPSAPLPGPFGAFFRPPNAGAAHPGWPPPMLPPFPAVGLFAQPPLPPGQVPSVLEQQAAAAAAAAAMAAAAALGVHPPITGVAWQPAQAQPMPGAPIRSAAHDAPLPGGDARAAAAAAEARACTAEATAALEVVAAVHRLLAVVNERLAASQARCQAEHGGDGGLGAASTLALTQQALAATQAAMAAAAALQSNAAPHVTSIPAATPANAVTPMPIPDRASAQPDAAAADQPSSSAAGAEASSKGADNPVSQAGPSEEAPADPPRETAVSEAEELRRKRLQRFQGQAQPTQEPGGEQ